MTEQVAREVCLGCETAAPGIVLRNRDYISNETFEVRVCTACGLGETVNPPADLTPYYGRSYYGTGDERFLRILESVVLASRRVRADRISAIRPPGSILDVGCGRGVMLSVLQARGWKVMGVELTDEAAAYARHRLGLDVQVRANLRDCALPSEELDVVTLFHVLEHLRDPLATLKEVWRILRPGGYLILTVPNLDSWQARLSDGAWFQLDAPRHLFHFTPRSLELVLQRTGFEVRQRRTHSVEYGYFSMLQSILNRFSSRPNVLYSFLRSRSTGLPVNWGRDLLLGLVGGPFVLAVSAPIEALAALCGRGAVVGILAQKTGQEAVAG